MAQSLRSSRRKLLVNFGLGGVGLVASSWTSSAAAFGSASPLASLLPGLTGTLNNSGLRQWSGAVGSTFIVQGESGPVAMILASVKALVASGARPAGLRSESFALVFESAAGARVPAGNRTYIFQQSSGNALQLFVGAKIAMGAKAQLVAIMN